MSGGLKTMQIGNISLSYIVNLGGVMLSWSDKKLLNYKANTF